MTSKYKIHSDDSTVTFDIASRTCNMVIFGIASTTYSTFCIGTGNDFFKWVCEYSM